MQLVGLATWRTTRLRGRLDTGERIALRAYRASSRVGVRGKLFMHAARRAELVKLRAVDAQGRELASTKLPAFVHAAGGPFARTTRRSA